ncbi:hypothetical protein EC957_001222 [Mortierella hygrophila]|uniref:EF-hand domain-containing protein n=1 Tax=Mortierella hygrophila TaxID=979708 RepID=A0A9P6F6Y6_9FUNG|nr:hypothetical protein EC957_001222 [Mortierella hygrophila]
MAVFNENQLAYIKTKFEEVDTDKNGSISLEELTALLKTLGGGEFSARISIAQFDENKDGRLTFDEFLEFAPTVENWNLQFPVRNACSSEEDNRCLKYGCEDS